MNKAELKERITTSYQAELVLQIDSPKFFSLIRKVGENVEWNDSAFVDALRKDLIELYELLPIEDSKKRSKRYLELTANTFQMGGATIIANDINSLREQVDEIRQLANETGSDLSKQLSDFCFSVEARYQQHHELDQDNWEMVHEI